MTDYNNGQIQGGDVMGMFDYVKWLGPLPKMPNRSRLRVVLENNKFQSKSVRLWEDERWSNRAYNEGCVTITVDKDGRMKDPDGADFLWTGTLNFYGGGLGCKQAEFDADFQNGKLIKIVETPK